MMRYVPVVLEPVAALCGRLHPANGRFNHNGTDRRPFRDIALRARLRTIIEKYLNGLSSISIRYTGEKSELTYPPHYTIFRRVSGFKST